MPEESTRTLLKIFGITVTNFEDSARQIIDKARASASHQETLSLVESLLRSASELNSRLLEVTELIFKRQREAFDEVSKALASKKS